MFDEKEYKRQWYLKNKEKIRAKGLTEEQKEAARERSKKWYRENQERHAKNCERSRKARQPKINKKCQEWRKDNPEKYKETCRRYREKNKERIQRVNKERKRLYPEQHKARQIANGAKRRGKITTPRNCQICNAKKRLEMHHSDYTRPLEITWCCKRCHWQLDKLRKEKEAICQ